MFIKFTHLLITSLALLLSCLLATQKETNANQIGDICVKKYSSESSNDFTGFMSSCRFRSDSPIPGLYVADSLIYRWRLVYVYMQAK